MNATPPVIGILLNYRDARRSEACVRSLLEDGAAGVLVWDNSADEAVSARELKRRLVGEERVSVHVSPQNVGFAVGVNLAIERCLREHPGVWVLIINNDAVLYDGALDALCRALQERPSALLAAPRIRQHDGVSGVVYHHRLSGFLFQHPKPGCSNHPSGCCLLFAPQRARLPLFDEDFFMYGEDCALGLRYRGGLEIVYLPEVLVRHDGTASSGLGSRFYEERMVAAHLILAGKLSDNPLARILYRVMRVLVLCARAARRSLRFRSWVPIQALGWGARLAWWSDPLLDAARRQAAHDRQPPPPQHH
jgi:GT2 family glycosyltransferase